VTVEPQRERDERAAGKQQLDQQIRARGAGCLKKRLEHGAIFCGLRYTAVSGAMPGVTTET